VLLKEREVRSEWERGGAKWGASSGESSLEQGRGTAGLEKEEGAYKLGKEENFLGRGA